jgi:hypothetical protein
MIPPKEKALELFDKFALGGWGKEHAITCVNEIYWMISQMSCDKTQELNYLLDIEEEIEKL